MMNMINNTVMISSGQVDDILLQECGFHES